MHVRDEQEPGGVDGAASGQLRSAVCDVVNELQRASFTREMETVGAR
jgi:hypothetical protein